jgi:hypothetical protein
MTHTSILGTRSRPDADYTEDSELSGHPEPTAHGNGSTSSYPSSASARLRPPLTFTHAIPWRIILHIGADSLASIGLEVGSNAIVVGRGDPAEGHAPGLDLGPFGAQDAGVSRRHAVIFASDESLFIRDLGSTNGTFVNGYTLEPNQPYRLSEGDRIEFGQMLLTFHVVNAPTR